MEAAKNALLVFIFLLISISLVRSILIYNDRFKIYNQLNHIYKKLEKQKIKLSTELKKSESSSYIEKVARDELQYTKEGEKIVVLPKPIPTKVQEKKEKKSIWKMWLSLLYD